MLGRKSMKLAVLVYVMLSTAEAAGAGGKLAKKATHIPATVQDTDIPATVDTKDADVRTQPQIKMVRKKVSFMVDVDGQAKDRSGDHSRHQDKMVRKKTAFTIDVDAEDGPTESMAGVSSSMIAETNFQAITSGDCVSQGMSYITTRSECGVAGAQLGVTNTYGGAPNPSGNRPKYCGTWGGMTYLHFNSQTTGSLNGYSILQTASSNARMICMQIWTVIDANYGCETNSQGISRSTYKTSQTLATCKQECVTTNGCVAIDFLSTNGWCNLYNSPCSTPAHGGAGTGWSSYKQAACNTGEFLVGTDYSSGSYYNTACFRNTMFPSARLGSNNVVCTSNCIYMEDVASASECHDFVKRAECSTHFSWKDDGRCYGRATASSVGTRSNSRYVSGAIQSNLCASAVQGS